MSKGQAPSEESFPASSRFWRLKTCPGSGLYDSSLCLCHHTASLGNCMSSFLSFMRIFIFGIRVHCNGMFPSQNLYLNYICKHSHSNILKFQVNMWKVKLLVSQSYLTLYSPTDCSPPGSSVHGIFQAIILEWETIPFSRGLPDPGVEPRTFSRSQCPAHHFFFIERMCQSWGLGTPVSVSVQPTFKSSPGLPSCVTPAGHLSEPQFFSSVKWAKRYGSFLKIRRNP